MSTCSLVSTEQTDQEERYNNSALTRAGNINFRRPAAICLKLDRLNWLNVREVS